MTIIVATKRPTFAVVAADRLWYGRSANGLRQQGEHQKLVVHPTAPVALATGGFAFLPVGNRMTSTTQLLQDLLSEVNFSMAPGARSLANYLTERLHPKVLTLLTDPRSVSDTRNKLDVFIALAHDGGTELARLRLTRAATFDIDARPDGSGCVEFLSAPRSLAGVYQSLPDDQLYGYDLPDAPSVAAHLRSVIGLGIQYEAALHNGRNSECGGGIDVVVIDRTAARLL